MPSLSPSPPLLLLHPLPCSHGCAPATLSSPLLSGWLAVALSLADEPGTLTHEWQRSWPSVAGLAVLLEHGSSLEPGLGSCSDYRWGMLHYVVLNLGLDRKLCILLSATMYLLLNIYRCIERVYAYV